MTPNKFCRTTCSRGTSPPVMYDRSYVEGTPGRRALDGRAVRRGAHTRARARRGRTRHRVDRLVDTVRTVRGAWSTGPPPVPGSQRPLAPDSRSPDPPPADGVSPSEADPVSSGGLPCRAVELYPRRSGTMRVIFCRTIKSLPTTRDESRHLSRSCPGRETGIVGRSWSSPGQVLPSGPGIVSGCRIHKQSFVGPK